jgi:ketosteroid isomerase-like protein
MILKLILFMMIYSLNGGDNAGGQNNEVAAAVEAFRNAVVDADAKTLSGLLAENLSYGHSDGKVEGKKDLIGKLSDGTYDFVTMDLTEQTIQLSGDVAIVRNRLDGKTNDGGKPNEAHLYVLMIWQKSGDGWKLIARQAVKRLPV